MQLSIDFLKKFQSSCLFIIVTSFILPAQQTNNESSVTVSTTIKKMASRINTTVDTDYIYDYDKSKFVPENGETLLIMGQTVEGINDYLKAFSNEAMPGGWSSYWGVTEFKGIKESFTNETGSSQNHQMLVDQFPNAVIHSAMWMVGNWDIAKNAGFGMYDKVLKKFAKWAKSSKRPIYLRIGYEFDGAHNQLEPKDYKNAYVHIVDFLRHEGVTNIAYVWHSYAAPTYKGYELSAWYPGDDYVDWVGISVFGQAYGGPDFGKETDEVLQFAKKHKKPVMIAESNPIGGIASETADSWDKWFVPFFNFIYSKNIKAVCFINENWQDLNIPGIEDWQDGRLTNNEMVAKAWFAETNKEKYLKASPTLFESLGFTEED